MEEPRQPASAAWPIGGGEMGATIRAHDWAATPLGPLADWPLTLRIAVGMIVASPFPSAVIWGPTLITIYNDAFQRILGGKPGALGQGFDTIWREVWPTIGPLAARALAGEATFIEDFPLVIERGGGPEQAYFTFAYSPLRDEHGAVAGFLDTVVETTTQARAEAALRASEARLRALVTASTYAVYRMSADWGEMYSLDGRGFLVDTPVPSASWLYSYILPEDREVVTVAIRLAIATRRLFELEHRVKRADGTIGWTLSRAVPLLDERGAITEWFGAASDITDRKRAEAALRERDELLALALRATGAGISTLDLATGSGETTPEWRDVLGLPAPPAPQTLDTFLAPVHPDDRERVATLHAAARRGEGLDFEFRVNHPARGERWLLSRSRHFPAAGGGPGRLVGLVVDITASKQAEVALRESEARYQATVTNLPGGAAFIVDRDLRYHLAGGDALRAAGFRPEDFAGRAMADVVGPARAAQQEPFYRRALAGEPFAVEHEDDGHTYLTRGVPLRDADGAITAVLALSFDITERKRAEAALRASEERFREFGAASADLLWIRDAATMRFEYLSPAFAALYGVDPAAIVGDDDLARWAALIHPDDRARTLANLERARAGARVAHEFRVIRPTNGAVRWLRDITFPFGGADGQVRRIGGIARDITDERRAAETVREAEERTRLAVEVAGLGTWDWDLPTDTVRWNDRHFALLGLPPRARPLHSADFLDRVHPADRGRVEAALVAARDARGRYDAEFRVVRADGTTRWMAGHGRVTAEVAGRATRMSGVMGDITDRKRAEADRERLLAAERDALAAAEATVRGRDEFLATAAHELRAPLARLRLGSQLLQLAGALGPTERDEALAIIERGSQRLETLVRDLVDLARLRTAQFALTLAPVDLGALVSEAVAEADERAGDGGRHRFALERPAALPSALADAERLMQVFANLLDNAVAYSPAGADVTVTVRAEGEGVAIAVRDRGLGLAPGEAEAIFAPFARAAAARARELSGLGLGLSIARGIVEQHGGRIGAASAVEGVGTTVTVWLPLAGPPGAATDAP